ncbi:MAG: DUF5082 family protein [Hespellia sp.]|nr:DUF5082 family protein [Hespellia sp.]
MRWAEPNVRLCKGKGCEDMTEADFDTQIQGKYQAISGLQGNIAELENEISELITVKGEVRSLQNKLKDTASGIESKMRSMGTLGGIVHSIINGSFFGKIADLAKGSEFRNAEQNLSEAQEVVQRKIQELRDQIEQKKTAIYSCQNQIGTLENGKTQFLQEKAAQEAEAAAQAQAQAEAAAAVEG